jgi:hypothetical protein
VVNVVPELQRSRSVAVILGPLQISGIIHYLTARNRSIARRPVKKKESWPTRIDRSREGTGRRGSQGAAPPHDGDEIEIMMRISAVIRILFPSITPYIVRHTLGEVMGDPGRLRKSKAPGSQERPFDGILEGDEIADRDIDRLGVSACPYCHSDDLATIDQ